MEAPAPGTLESSLRAWGAREVPGSRSACLGLRRTLLALELGARVAGRPGREAGGPQEVIPVMQAKYDLG